MMPAQSKPAILGWTLLKLGGCGAIIAAIAATIVIVGADGQVRQSQADITWFGGLERDNQEAFEDGLERLGHGAPQRYDLNGNTLFFSTQNARKRPRQLMAEYQEEFVRQGINDTVYTDLAAQGQSERSETALTGGLIPLVLTDDYVALAGVLTDNDADDRQELLTNLKNAPDRSDLFRAHRMIEFRRAPDSRHTQVTASWSDGNFDYQRMIPGSDAPGQSFDDTLPACPGCTRLARFGDDAPGARQVAISFIGPRTIAETRQFYAQRLRERGWQRRDRNAGLDAAQAHLATALPDGESDAYRRGDRHLLLSFLVDDRTGHTLTLATYD